MYACDGGCVSEFVGSLPMFITPLVTPSARSTDVVESATGPISKETRPYYRPASPAESLTSHHTPPASASGNGWPLTCRYGHRHMKITGAAACHFPSHVTLLLRVSVPLSVSAAVSMSVCRHGFLSTRSRISLTPCLFVINLKGRSVVSIESTISKPQAFASGSGSGSGLSNRRVSAGDELNGNLEEAGMSTRSGSRGGRDVLLRAPSLDSLSDGSGDVVGRAERTGEYSSGLDTFGSAGGASADVGKTDVGEDDFDEQVRGEKERERVMEEEQRRGQLFVVETSLWANAEREKQVRRRSNCSLHVFKSISLILPFINPLLAPPPPPGTPSQPSHLPSPPTTDGRTFSS